MNRTDKNRAVETVENQTTVSHRSHSLYCYYKKKKPIVYTKYLTLPL